MIRSVGNRLWCRLLSTAAIALSSCGGGGQVLPDGAGREFGGQLTEWSESWESAPLGTKTDFEVFEADSGSWETRLDPPDGLKESDGHVGGAEVRVVEGKGLVLQSHSDLIHEVQYVDSGIEGVPGFFFTSELQYHGMAEVTQEINPQENITAETPLPLTHGVVFTRDSTFSGIFNCEMHSARDLALDGEALAAGIELNIFGWLLPYFHEGSTGPLSSDPTLRLVDGIYISANFQRNVYNDLVSVYGQRFTDWYEWYEENRRFVNNIRESMEPVKFQEIRIEVLAIVHEDGGISGDCTCFIDDLRIANP